MPVIIVIIHIAVCIALILIVLLQTGKGADMGAAFGGGASQTLFGTTGASTFLSKATTAAAVVFMLTSLTLAYIADNSGGNTRLVTEPPRVPAQTQTVPQSAPGTAPPATKQPPAAQSRTEGKPAPQSAPAAPSAGQAAKPAHNQGQTKP